MQYAAKPFPAFFNKHLRPHHKCAWSVSSCFPRWRQLATLEGSSCYGNATTVAFERAYVVASEGVFDLRSHLVREGPWSIELSAVGRVGTDQRFLNSFEQPW